MSLHSILLFHETLRFDVAPAVEETGNDSPQPCISAAWTATADKLRASLSEQQLGSDVEMT